MQFGFEFERSEDDKRAKCKHCPWEKAVVVERMKDHWNFVSDVSDFCVFDMFLTSNFYV